MEEKKKKRGGRREEEEDENAVKIGLAKGKRIKDLKDIHGEREGYTDSGMDTKEVKGESMRAQDSQSI